MYIHKYTYIYIYASLYDTTLSWTIRACEAPSLKEQQILVICWKMMNPDLEKTPRGKKMLIHFQEMMLLTSQDSSILYFS